MIHYITGGARSGKSNHAQCLALSLTDHPIYLATSRIWDADFENRVRRHQDERDHRWENIEEEKFLSQLDLTDRVVVIDCVTLWITNFFVDNAYDIEKTLSEVKIEVDKLASKDCTLIIISNEIGMGVHAETDIGRKFTDLQGWVNQHIAKVADRATMMVSGLPLQLK